MPPKRKSTRTGAKPKPKQKITKAAAQQEERQRIEDAIEDFDFSESIPEPRTIGKGGNIYQAICESGGDVVELRRALIVSMEARPSWTFFVDNNGNMRPTHGVCQTASKVVETKKVANQLKHMMSSEGSRNLDDVSFNLLNGEMEHMDGVNNAKLSNSTVTRLRYLQELYNNPSELSEFRREVADLLGEKNLHGLHVVRPDGAERKDTAEIVNAILFYPSSHSSLVAVMAKYLGIGIIGFAALVWFYNNGKSPAFNKIVDDFGISKWVAGSYTTAAAGFTGVVSNMKSAMTSLKNNTSKSWKDLADYWKRRFHQPYSDSPSIVPTVRHGAAPRPNDKVYKHIQRTPYPAQIPNAKSVPKKGWTQRVRDATTFSTGLKVAGGAGLTTAGGLYGLNALGTATVNALTAGL